MKWDEWGDLYKADLSFVEVAGVMALALVVVAIVWVFVSVVFS